MKALRAAMPDMDFSPAPVLIAEIAAGRMVVLLDDEARENEGDLVMAAACVTPDSIAFMADQGRGLICLALDGSIADRLELNALPVRNEGRFGTAFLDPIEARRGVTTGICAADRATTIRIAVDPRSGPEDVSTPGHVFPLRARAGGVLERAGHTEAAVDLARLAGLSPAGVICEIMGADGVMLRGAALMAYARRTDLKIGTIADLIRFRREISL